MKRIVKELKKGYEAEVSKIKDDIKRLENKIRDAEDAVSSLNATVEERAHCAGGGADGRGDPLVDSGGGGGAPFSNFDALTAALLVLVLRFGRMAYNYFTNENYEDCE